jgi:F-type H+-transporting ATPase subunit b
LGEALSAMGINGPFLLSQIVNFLILFVVLSVFLWKPAMRRLDERRQMLEKEKTDAAALAEARASIEAERERTLEEARGEAERVIAEAQEQAKALTEQAAQEARQEAENLLADGRQGAEEERNRILGEMRGQIAALAIAASQKIIGEALDEQRQQALVESFFSGIRDDRVEVLPEGVEVGLPGVLVTVTSAIPLTDEQQAIVQRDLATHLGEEREVAFRVDPRILGGLLVRVGDRVVDGSVAGQLERLHRSLA